MALRYSAAVAACTDVMLFENVHYAVQQALVKLVIHCCFYKQ